MPSTAKPKTSASPRSVSSSNGRSAKKASGSSRARSTPSRGKSSGPADSIAHKARKAAGTVAQGAAAAAVGTAVAALAGRALISSRRRRRVLGVPLPRKRTNVKRVAKQLSSMAGELEKKSLDVSKASGQVKQAAEILS